MTLATILPFIVALPFVGALLTAFMPRDGAAAGPASVAGAVALFGLVASMFLYSTVSGGGALKYDVEWLPQLVTWNQSKPHFVQLLSQEQEFVLWLAGRRTSSF